MFRRKKDRYFYVVYDINSKRITGEATIHHPCFPAISALKEFISTSIKEKYHIETLIEHVRVLNIIETTKKDFEYRNKIKGSDNETQNQTNQML